MLVRVRNIGVIEPEAAVYRGFKCPRCINQNAGDLPMVTDQDWFERKSTIYDNDGRTTVPKKAMDTLGLADGDKIKFVNADGIIIIKKLEEQH